jgi:hypothetical protein
VTQAVLARASVDKKRRGAAIRFVFCRGPGDVVLEDVTAAELAEWAAEFCPTPR